ncbi:phage tail protein [Rouxiella sp. Mn2063]|uniref:phage tail-collar fiber domain-containing protein n=1 Tax=Rouxiella sp. Mn2063 TaxID=3395262 RepID=UPI003BC1D6AE
MADKYYSIITNTGKALEAAALANGTTITLSHFVVGDGSGKELVPDATSTKLVNEKYRQKIAMLSVSPEQANQLMAQLVIPSEVGGFTVREIGLLTDKGELYALANCAAIEKPVGGINISMQFRLAVSDTANITLQVATGDGLFLRMDRNLSDVKDVSTARTNLGLKTAALRDVGTDAGQVMPVGAFGVGGQAPKLSNPSNVKYSGFFGYGGNTDPSLKDWGSVISNFYGESGEYCSQLYLPSDQREALIRFMKNGKSVWSSRLYHEGNKPSAADVGAYSQKEADEHFYSKNGGLVSGNVDANGYVKSGNDLVSGQDIWSGRDIYSARNIDARGGVIQLSGDDRKHLRIINGDGTVRMWFYKDKGGDGIHLNNGDDGGGEFVFQKNGRIAIPNGIDMNGGVRIEIDGNIWGSRWGNKWLWDAIIEQVNSRASSDYVNGTFIKDLRLSGRGTIVTDGQMNEAPFGAVVTGGNGNEGNQVGYMYFRYLQKNVNNNWYTVAYA